MSVFETIAIRNGRAILAEPHFRKLTASIERVRFRPPLEWEDAARDILEEPPVDEGVARIYITAGDGRADLEVVRSRVVMIIESMTIPCPEEICTVKAFSIPFIPQLPPGKTGNYWQHLIANANAGPAEAVLVNPEGTVIGGAMANFFAVIRGRILCPRSHGDIRLGTVHDWVARNFSVTETHLTIADLERLEDAFFTNSRVGIRRIGELDGVDPPGHPLVDEIWDLYRSEVLNGGGS